MSYESIENKRRKIIYTVITLLLIISLLIFGTSHSLRGNLRFGIIDILLAFLFSGFIFLIHKIKHPVHIYRTTMVLLSCLLVYWLITGAINGYASMWIFILPLMTFYLMGKKEGTIWTILLFVIILIIFYSSAYFPFIFKYKKSFYHRHISILIIIIIFTYNYEWTREEFKKGILKDQRNLIIANKEAERINHLLEQEMEERKKSESALKVHKAQLEITIENRTKEIFQKNIELHEVLQNLQNSEAALKKSENDLLITLNSIGDGVISTDENERIIRMNPAAEKITGHKKDQAVNKNINKVLPLIDRQNSKPIDSPADIVSQINNHSVFSQNAILINNDRKEYILSVSYAAIKNNGDNIVGYVIVFKDISEEYFLQEKLRESQKMEAIGQLAGGVAHDFNNMLGGILGAAQLLERKADENESLLKYIRLIINSSIKASSLTNQLLAFSRKGNMSFSPLKISDILENALLLLKRSIDKKIIIEITDDSRTNVINGNSTALENVFINLGINSAHAMEKGGSLNFIIKNIFLNESFCDNSSFDIKPGKYVAITVRDTGKGIANENMNKIFEPFYTTKPQGKGTGLGLSVVYGTIIDHNGAVIVSSEPGIGTSFMIYLPVANNFSEAVGKEDNIIKGKGTILIVDDEEIIRITTDKILKHLGYTTILAENGKDGLKIYSDKHETIDLVLLDMMMPEMNGIECFEQLKEINPEVKVVVATGFSEKGDISTIQKQGLNGYIQKPYTASKLSNIIADILNS